MDHPNQNTMLLPASYAVISEEEMTYLEGGSTITLGRAFGYEFTLDTDQFLTFCSNVLTNAAAYMFSASYSYVVNLLQSGLSNGLSLRGTVLHVWGKQETTWGKIATIGVTGMAGVYLGAQIYSAYTMIKSLYDSIVNPMPDFSGAQTAQSTQAAA